MKLLHVSDTHVGFSAYSRVDATGLNQREVDFFDAFTRAIDVAIEKRVDLLLHSGDLFDTVRPTNRAISHVMTQLRRLHERDIPAIVISGNHEAPRLRETGAVLRLLEFVPGVHAVYKGQTERIRIGDLVVHATPHAADNTSLLEQLRAVRRDESARWNVATLHAGVLGVGDFRTGEFHEQVVPQNELPQDMDYVALGHYHRATELAQGVWYAGSTERCTFKEAGEAKSVNLVDLARGRVEPIPLATRPMRDVPSLACEGMQEADIAAEIYKRLEEAELEGVIARFRVHALPHHVYGTLDFTRIRRLTEAAMHFDFQAEILRDDAPGLHQGHLGELADEFESFLARRTLHGEHREKILQLAQTLLRDAQEGESDGAQTKLFAEEAA